MPRPTLPSPVCPSRLSFQRLCRVLPILAILLWIGAGTSSRAADAPVLLPIETRVTHGFATNGDVKIHYARLGEGPLVVLVHGFPDCWLTWRDVMADLSDKYETVAMDQRGYNLSDKPKGVENYDMLKLTSDVAAVIRARGRDKAIVVGHDWGGGVSWAFAMMHPEMTERLAILNLPHPRGLMRELAHNPDQQKASAYARRFQMPGSHTNLTAEGLTFWVKDPVAKARYLEVFRRSDFEGMLNFYKRNYPREPYTEDTSPVVKVKCPVLMMHGLEDTALLSPALDGNWNWVEQDLTLVTIPGAGHFVQQDASVRVTRTLRMWLDHR